MVQIFSTREQSVFFGFRRFRCENSYSWIGLYKRNFFWDNFFGRKTKLQLICKLFPYELFHSSAKRFAQNEISNIMITEKSINLSINLYNWMLVSVLSYTLDIYQFILQIVPLKHFKPIKFEFFPLMGYVSLMRISTRIRRYINREIPKNKNDSHGANSTNLKSKHHRK